MRILVVERGQPSALAREETRSREVEVVSGDDGSYRLPLQDFKEEAVAAVMVPMLDAALKRVLLYLWQRRGCERGEVTAEGVKSKFISLS